MKQVRPAIGNEGFTLARASFYPDESFEAVAIRDGETIKAKGTYDYCCCRDELTLNMGDETRVLKAYRKSCVRLDLKDTADDGEVATLVMRGTDKCDRHADCRHPPCCRCD
jgi:hypothetical protein